jgi:hypothetical protein
MIKYKKLNRSTTESELNGVMEQNPFKKTELKSDRDSGRSKKLSFGICTAVVAVAASILTFYGCKKDTDNLDPNGKMHKYVLSEREELKALEFYTPDEETLSDKLLSFTNYMNSPEAYPMPNMEIKEAIWFMETFFNFGIVYKQQHGVKKGNLVDETDFINVPFETDADGMIFLNGEVLQSLYRELLTAVKSRFSPKYAINFCDVYVEAIDYSCKKATIAVRKKTGDAAPVEYQSTGMLKIVRMNFPSVVYPHSSNPADKFSYIIKKEPQPDTGMMATLNQERQIPDLYAINIINERWTNFSPPARVQ